jgi:predicted Zn-dependent protease
MAVANIDPQHLSNFFFRLSRKDRDVPEAFVWISTHPDTKERAAEIIRQKKEYTFTSKPLLYTDWDTLKKLAARYDDDEDFRSDDDSDEVPADMTDEVDADTVDTH